MQISEVTYLGNLRTACKHLKSGDTFITDAPTDNNGKGEAFSPTDILVTSLASCAITIIGIYCNKNKITFENCEASVQKLMGNNPRKVDQIIIEMKLSENNWEEATLNKVIEAARSCPVELTLKNNVQIEYKFT
ncbi:OsmC family protein [Crocinitomicaceae bacterium]|nr:OsmC family protein [Crocinitomicaceae bacterium]